MNPLESNLRDSLRRRQPPHGFAERTLARLQQSRRNERPSRWERLRGALSGPGWRWAMTGAGVLVLGIGLFSYRESARRSEGERAREEVLYALRLTGSALRQVQEHVNKVPVKNIEIITTPALGATPPETGGQF